MSKPIRELNLELGRPDAAEALRRLEVEDFPVTVVIDCEGNNLYEQGRKAYLESVAADEV